MAPPNRPFVSPLDRAGGQPTTSGASCYAASLDGFIEYRAELNLHERPKRSAFHEEIRALVTAWPEGYDIDAAAEFVITDVLSLIE